MSEIGADQEALFVYGSYNKLINNEKHYTILQAKYRKLTTYWLMVMFAAIGIIFSSSETGIPFDHLSSTIILCLIGITGICFLWYEDLVIQERFLNLNHLEAFRFENLYSWLPKVHHQHVCFTHKKMMQLKVTFYVGCNLILFVIMTAAVVIYMIRYSFLLTFALLLIELSLFILLSKSMFSKTYQSELSALKEISYVRH